MLSIPRAINPNSGMTCVPITLISEVPGSIGMTSFVPVDVVSDSKSVILPSIHTALGFSINFGGRTSVICSFCVSPETLKVRVRSSGSM